MHKLVLLVAIALLFGCALYGQSSNAELLQKKIAILEQLNQQYELKIANQDSIIAKQQAIISNGQAQISLLTLQCSLKDTEISYRKDFSSIDSLRINMYKQMADYNKPKWYETRTFGLLEGVAVVVLSSYVVKNVINR